MNKNIKTKEGLKKEIDRLSHIAITLFVICIPCVAIFVISSVMQEHNTLWEVVKNISAVIVLMCATFSSLLCFYLAGLDARY